MFGRRSGWHRQRIKSEINNAKLLSFALYTHYELSDCFACCGLVELAKVKFGLFGNDIAQGK
ncbi:hypothetical protein VIAQ111709_07830 [Vibrio aquimaris]|uniref:Uncharacterized protein n=1 Tax=Vibrio aquimaris TaxID=2587862 RepID=A0A5P9CJL6_9VIBR|nr:hypothetical protein FIV01_08345 [Vibrio aquimaris]